MTELRKESTARIDGWLQKEGKYFKTRYARYMRLEGHLLSNHYEKGGPATWEISVADCLLSVGPRENEFVIVLTNRRVCFFAPSTKEVEEWTAELQLAGMACI